MGQIDLFENYMYWIGILETIYYMLIICIIVGFSSMVIVIRNGISNFGSDPG